MTFVNSLKGYKVLFTESAKKQLKSIDPRYKKAIDKKLDELAQGNQSLDIKKLIAYDRATFRLRVGDYRVIYEVYEHEIIVRIIKVKHRKDAYKGEQ